MALVPVIQPPIMKLLTTREERLIRMKPPRQVSQTREDHFSHRGFLDLHVDRSGAIVLLGMLFFGNLLKESMVTERLAKTARTAMIDIVTILLGFAVGASTQARDVPASQIAADLWLWVRYRSPSPRPAACCSPSS